MPSDMLQIISRHFPIYPFFKITFRNLLPPISNTGWDFKEDNPAVPQADSYYGIEAWLKFFATVFPEDDW